jgi:hypothetical protein
MEAQRSCFFRFSGNEREGLRPRSRAHNDIAHSATDELGQQPDGECRGC